MYGLYILDGHLVIGHASQVKTKLGHFVQLNQLNCVLGNVKLEELEFYDNCILKKQHTFK